MWYNASQLTTDTIDNPEDHDIYDNSYYQPSNEEPPKSIAEGGQDSVQTDVTAVENPVSCPIS